MTDASSHLLTATTKDAIHVFVNDLEKGEFGEYTVKQYLQRFPYVRQIEDKSGEYAYQKADIDLLAQLNNGNIVSIEVKNDASLFPNLFFETKSVVQSGRDTKPGCSILSDAGMLFYVYQGLDVVVVTPLDALNAWVADYLASDRVRFKKGYPLNKGYRTKKPANGAETNDYTGEGYRIPLKALLGEQDGLAGVPGLSIRDLQTNQTLTFEAFNALRLRTKQALGGTNYVKLEAPKGWRTRNQSLYPNKGVLDIPLRNRKEREQDAIATMNQLDALYDQI